MYTASQVKGQGEEVCFREYHLAAHRACHGSLLSDDRGENVLRLILNLSNGKTVEKKTKVFVNYVISMEQSVRQVGNATEVTLKYQYDKVHPVDVPSIFITDASIVSGEIKYIGTQTKTRDGSVYAETTYQINWPR